MKVENLKDYLNGIERNQDPRSIWNRFLDILLDAFETFAEENQPEPEKDLGCVLSGIDGNCIKLNLVCSGTREERHKCPLWGYVTMADYRLIRKKE